MAPAKLKKIRKGTAMEKNFASVGGGGSFEIITKFSFYNLYQIL